jgi:hypothetical protein
MELPNLVSQLTLIYLMKCTLKFLSYHFSKSFIAIMLPPLSIRFRPALTVSEIDGKLIALQPTKLEGSKTQNDWTSVTERVERKKIQKRLHQRNARKNFIPAPFVTLCRRGTL